MGVATRTVIALALALTSCAAPAATVVDTTSPESVARAWWDAMRADDVALTLSHMLPEIREEYRPALERPLSDRGLENMRAPIESCETSIHGTPPRAAMVWIHLGEPSTPPHRAGCILRWEDGRWWVDRW